jgi:hypothetical protein
MARRSHDMFPFIATYLTSIIISEYYISCSGKTACTSLLYIYRTRRPFISI